MVRDVLGLAKNAREARIIIKEGGIRVNGKTRRDEGFPVGPMDVCEIGEDKFRVLPHRSKGLILHAIDEEEAGFRLCRIEGKSTVKGGDLQLNLHDGTNLLIRIKNPAKPVEDVYHRFDTLKLAIPSREILDHVRFGEDAYVLVLKGRNAGGHGVVTGVETRGTESPIVVIRTKGGESIRSIRDYVFCIGSKKPWIGLAD